MTYRGLTYCLSTLLLCSLCHAVHAERFIVKDGKALAQIVISDTPKRTARFAAGELQLHLQRISGATLPIVTEPSPDVPVSIYVGRSKYTDQRKLDNTGLKYGAFHMRSGEDWLALLGRDTDTVHIEPHAQNPQDKTRVLAEWDKITGETWGNPRLSVHRRYSPLWDIWESDERGSLNAVYAFLRSLGMRWYHPGELGRIVPSIKTIALPRVDRTDHPDFAVRHLFIYYHEFFMARPGLEARAESIKWQLWLGLSSKQEVLGYSIGHGTMIVHAREEVKRAHPEYYALWGGKRATEHLGNYGAACLSSEGLFEQNVKFVRAMFDHYNEPMTSVAPADGYISLCQCELCKGKDTPERGWDGLLSDYVWGYTQRVAQEVYKTHPDHKITCIAYSAYQLPPLKIDQFSPNIVVGLCRWRSLFHDPQVWQERLELRKQWLAKLPAKQFFIWEYYLHGRPNSPYEAMPVYFPQQIAKDLRSLKGISLGDYVEVYSNKGAPGDWDALASNHLNCYVTARYLWDADQDLDQLLEAYYDDFYGPARSEMKQFIEFAAANWNKANKNYQQIDQLFEKIGAARAAAGNTVYGQRIDLIIQYMDRLKQLRERLVQGRDQNPKARALRRNKHKLTLDGKMDEPFWEGLPLYHLSDLQTGARPHFGTTFKMAWSNDALVFGIHCADNRTSGPNIAAYDNEDPNIWNGDVIEILLETQSHEYYQIAVGPSGAVMDLDRQNNGFNARWSSQTTAASHITDDGWTLEVRIPIVGETNADIDPLNGVAGRKPHKTYPWYFNVCRQRVSDKSKELTAFSPTGKPNFHDVMKFAELISP